MTGKHRTDTHQRQISTQDRHTSPIGNHTQRHSHDKVSTQDRHTSTTGKHTETGTVYDRLAHRTDTHQRQVSTQRGIVMTR